MRFNIVYLGPTILHNLRRDFILALKIGLEKLGHRAFIAEGALIGNGVNLLVGAYFLKPEQARQLIGMNVPFININTEVIKQGMLNFQPGKVDLGGVYVPLMRAGLAAWDVILDNIAEYGAYGIGNAHFLRWGWLPELEEIRHDPDKDLDFYFFGMMSARRKLALEQLRQAGLRGLSDESCPYFVRNDRIARAKVQLNIVQEDLYTHVNSFRICYLANNRCAILSEKEEDPAGYLETARIADLQDFAAQIRDLAAGDNHVRAGDAAYEKFRRIPMTECLGALLEATFGGAAAKGGKW